MSGELGVCVFITAVPNTMGVSGLWSVVFITAGCVCLLLQDLR